MTPVNAETHPALLPNGLSDLVPPFAEAEQDAVNQLLACYAGFGYQLVKPPLMEFEAGLLRGPGAALAPQTFRLMDPISQRMLGLRADITSQIARIAGSRLQSAPRPLRLSYSGEVVRVTGSQLRPERQFCQVGAELIGTLSPAADAEVAIMAVSALRGLGIADVSMDFCLPTLLPYFLQDGGLDEAASEALEEAVRRRDREAVEAVKAPVSTIISKLLAASGPVKRALEKLAGIEVPAQLRVDIDRLLSVVAAVQRDLPDLTVTIDPLERRGFEYQTGLSFTLFAKGVRGELGRGGRYRSAGVASKMLAQSAANPMASAGEPAVGFTLFMDSIMRALPGQAARKRLLVAADATLVQRQALVADGWVVVNALEQTGDDGSLMKLAHDQHCSHVLQSGKPVPV